MQVVARNRKALHDYEILEKVEAGIELQGCEVKSIRAAKVNLADSYAQCVGGEIYLNHMHISPYERTGIGAPDPYRKRKLLLHKRQIAHLSAEVERKRLTVVPLNVYFTKQWVKVEIGLCKGKRSYDKRRSIADRESKKRLAALVKAHR